MQELFNQVKLQSKNIRYTDYQLQGKHIADIAFTRSGQLIDFRKKDGRLATKLRKIADQLDFPRVCYDPLLIHFLCEQGIQKPTGIQIYNSNKLILEKTFPTKTEIIHLEGLKGNVVLELAKDHSVRFVESSCKHKTCMTMGTINKAGQNLVCIPNQIAVTINGTNTSGADSITF